MYFNVHTHIFPLRTVLSREAVRVVTQRLEDHGVPRMLVRAVTRVLDRQLDRPEILDERELLVRLLGELRGVSGFDRFVEANLAHLPFHVVIRGEGLESLPVETLRQALDQLTSALARDEVERGAAARAFDVVATLRLAMRSTATEVADQLLEQMGPEDALVALMMDVRAPDEPERDRRNFNRQIAGTREAALQRPGRILPFFAVHPDRPDHFQLLEKGIAEGAFLGVKLYPSLGYRIEGPKLMRVYEFCADADVPILLHCSHGGFYRQGEFVDYCDPAHWESVLQGPLADLRVCFAHFGGWDSLGRPGGLDEGTWGGTILRLMRERSGVFTDLAFHSDQMHDREDEERYFLTLEALLAEEALCRRILFGTDSWLLRLEMTEAVFWRYYRERMKPESFELIARLGPKEFLGFPQEPGGEPRANLRRHLDFLVAHRDAVGAEAPSWLVELTGQAFEAGREPADWRRRSFPTQCTYRLAHHYMSPAQRRGGYAANRSLRLRELRCFRPRDPNFEGVVCPGLARDLVGACESTGAGYVAGWDRDAALARLTEAFRRGDKELVEVARLLDTIFAFEEGLV